MKPIIVPLCVFLIFWSPGTNAQANFTFSYHDKPVTPEALLAFFPSMAEGSSVDSVDLDNSTFTLPVVRETNFYIRSNSEVWWRCNLRDPGSFTWYNVSGTVKNKFIVIGYLNDGGTLTQVGVFFLAIKGHMLYRVGAFYPREAPDGMVIKGNEVIYHGVHYKVPE